MKQAIYGTFPVVYPPAAAYFDCEAGCALADGRCDGPVKVHAYFYTQGTDLVDADGEIVAEVPPAAELLLADGIDYVELCAIHHGEWWKDQREEFVARAKADITRLTTAGPCLAHCQTNFAPTLAACGSATPPHQGNG